MEKKQKQIYFFVQYVNRQFLKLWYNVTIARET